jgi:hypothetical protein
MAESILRKDIQKMAEEMASGKFRDSGRIPGFGESMDSMTGVPLRVFIDRAQKGNFGQGLLDAASSIGTDPKNAPTTEQLTEQAIPDSNPLAKTGLKTALDFADLTSIIPQGKAIKGLGATIRKSDKIVPFPPPKSPYAPSPDAERLVEIANAQKNKKVAELAGLKQTDDLNFNRKNELLSVQSKLDSMFKRMSSDVANLGIALEKHPRFQELQELQALKEKLTTGGK